MQIPRIGLSHSAARVDAVLSEDNWIHLGQNVLEYPSAAKDGKFLAGPALLSIIVSLK